MKIKENEYYIVYKDETIIINGQVDNDCILETKWIIFITPDKVGYENKLATLKNNNNEQNI